MRFVLVRCILLVGHALRNTEASASRLGLTGLAASEVKDAAGAQKKPPKWMPPRKIFGKNGGKPRKIFGAGPVLGQVNPFI